MVHLSKFAEFCKMNENIAKVVLWPDSKIKMIIQDFYFILPSLWLLKNARGCIWVPIYHCGLSGPIHGIQKAMERKRSVTDLKIWKIGDGGAQDLENLRPWAGGVEENTICWWEVKSRSGGYPLHISNGIVPKNTKVLYNNFFHLSLIVTIRWHWMTLLTEV